jgi:hypothetical protein
MKRRLNKLQTIDNEQTQRQRGALFLPNEYVGYKSSPFENSYTPAPLFCLNPIKSATSPRTLDSLTAHRNFLIEFDRPSMTLTKQEQYYEQTLQLPYTTKTYSGARSIHYVIALTGGLQLQEYRLLSELLHAVIRLNDSRVKNANRLSRTAGMVRPETGVRQELLGIGPRIDTASLHEQLASLEPVLYNKARMDFYKRMEPRNSMATGERIPLHPKWQQVLETGRLPSGYTARRDVLLACGVGLVRDGAPLEQVEQTLVELQAALGIERDDVTGLMKWLSALP